MLFVLKWWFFGPSKVLACLNLWSLWRVQGQDFSGQKDVLQMHGSSADDPVAIPIRKFPNKSAWCGGAFGDPRTVSAGRLQLELRTKLATSLWLSGFKFFRLHQPYPNGNEIYSQRRPSFGEVDAIRVFGCFKPFVFLWLPENKWWDRFVGISGSERPWLGFIGKLIL